MSLASVVSSMETSSVFICGVVLCSIFLRMVEASTGGGIGGSGGIAELLFSSLTNYSSKNLGSTPGFLLRGTSTTTTGLFSYTFSISLLLSYSTTAIS